MNRERPAKPKPVDLALVKTYPIRERPTKVDFSLLATPADPEAPLADFFETLPAILKAAELLTACRKLAEAREKGRGVILMMGAHVIKCGLGPIVIRMMEEGLVTCIALNGAGAIHDFELATTGGTSEDVEAGLEDGSFGMVRETAEAINRMVGDGARFGYGLGEAICKGMRHMMPRHEKVSILANAARLGVPLTISVALGTDTIHQHASCDGEAWGKGAMRDFKLLAGIVSTIHDGGAVINAGSAVILPEVFLKALTVARNVNGPVSNFTAINLDMIQHYRPNTNVVKRPTRGGGTPISLTGHHEIMIPLLYAGVKSCMRASR